MFVCLFVFFVSKEDGRHCGGGVCYHRITVTEKGVREVVFQELDLGCL